MILAINGIIPPREWIHNKSISGGVPVKRTVGYYLL